ncbi:MAG: cupredoxin domain-containing protein [Actinomycetota bacterium]
MLARRTGLVGLAAVLLVVLGGTALAWAAGGSSVTVAPDRLPVNEPLSSKRAQAAGDVEVRDNLFDPDSIEVDVGGTITWAHAGQAPHTVTADDGSFDSHPGCNPDTETGCMQNGDTFEQTFDEPGEFRYYCKIHGGEGGAGMAGVVIVGRPRPTPAPPGESDEEDTSMTQGGDELPATGSEPLVPIALGLNLLVTGAAAVIAGRREMRG